MNLGLVKELDSIPLFSFSALWNEIHLSNFDPYSMDTEYKQSFNLIHTRHYISDNLSL